MRASSGNMASLKHTCGGNKTLNFTSLVSYIILTLLSSKCESIFTGYLVKALHVSMKRSRRFLTDVCREKEHGQNDIISSTCTTYSS